MELNNQFNEYVEKTIHQAREYYKLGYLLEADELMASIGYAPNQAGFILSVIPKNDEN